MTFTNTATRYGTVAKSLHWLTAFLILTLIPTGIIANGMPFDTAEELAAKAQLFTVHKTMGVLIFFVALARILWAITQKKPDPLHPERKAESVLADMVHWLLYGSLLLVPLTGWIHHASTEGFAPIWWPFGQNLPFVPESEALAATTAGLHIVFERVLVISIFLHVVGALKHHFFDKDDTLRRMWFGATEAGSGAPRTSQLVPLGGAIAAWITAVFVGLGIGAYDQHDSAIAAVALEEVNSDWTVTEGTLEIAVTQLGSVVQGSFADWTAAIRFDENANGPTVGDVDVTIAIPSLTLGSVTNEALGPDYFGATDFPTARFEADLLKDGDTYVADGTLTIRDSDVPTQLPFALTLDGDTAEMTGSLTLDRRDFGIGDKTTDEGTLGFAVSVDIALTANRTAK